MVFYVYYRFIAIAYVFTPFLSTLIYSTAIGCQLRGYIPAHRTHATGDVSATENSDIRALDSGSCDNVCEPWSNFVVILDHDGSLEYETMSSGSVSSEGSVSVSGSKIPVELENRGAWQPSCAP